MRPRSNNWSAGWSITTSAWPSRKRKETLKQTPVFTTEYAELHRVSQKNIFQIPFSRGNNKTFKIRNPHSVNSVVKELYVDKKSKIYVAGHRGLAGSTLVRSLRAQGYDNLVYRTHQELDLIRQADVEAFFQKEKPDAVFLAAAKVGGILANETYQADFIYQNLTVQSNIMQAAYQSGVKELLFLGSSCIYPNDKM